jgi:hypothetical protein
MSKKQVSPNYLDLLDAVHKLGKGEGGVFIATVKHDSWCAHWKGKPCNCNPTVKTTRRDGE